MVEPRAPVMILVEASWQDQKGKQHSLPARMEDRSDGGACVRLKAQIPVGARMGIEWRWEKFAGVVRYCRSEGTEYIVGLERGVPEAPPEEAPWREHIAGGSVIGSTGTVSTAAAVPAAAVSTTVPNDETAVAEVAPLQRPLGSLLGKIPVSKRRVEDRPTARLASPPSAKSAPPFRKIATARPAEPRAGPLQDPPTAGRPPDSAPQAENANKQRKPAPRKWLEKASANSKPDVPSANGDADGCPDASPKNRMPALTTSEPSATTAALPDEKDDASFQTELAPMEDIYRVAGITLPRKGYSIKKVIEMLDSQHIRDLSKETKRVVVLVALDAVGVPIDDVLNDAKARRQALDSYEADVKKRAAAEWARKQEENIQIEAELERLTARITRNLEALAREKAAFDNWITRKQEESQSITDAAELCVNASASEEAPAPAATPAKAFAKTAQ